MQAACGLCVNVGSFSDPPDISGLAHLLEHSEFLGGKNCRISQMVYTLGLTGEDAILSVSLG